MLHTEPRFSLMLPKVSSCLARGLYQIPKRDDRAKECSMYVVKFQDIFIVFKAKKCDFMNAYKCMLILLSFPL